MSQSVFTKVPSELDFPREEREILSLWKSARIFEKSLDLRAGAPTFVFYEGPPTANGTPHNGHVLTRVIKDLFPRYKTMRGFRVPRKAGWDTHGLPVEVEVEKELRIHGKAAIEQYGVEPFAKKCIESVFRYTEEWERLTERIGFWVDLPSAYVTFHESYVQSVWWALSELFKKGLLYRGHKVVWWWAQGGTALSSGEVGQGYREVDDPSVYVRFPLADAEGDLAGASLLVWTTTPWTLPSNMYAAVGPKIDYALVEVSSNRPRSGGAGDAPSGQKLVVAKGLLEALKKKIGCENVLRDVSPSELIGKHYTPPFDLYRDQGKGHEALWSVIAADFVTLDAGTGIVHIAPAFGEDDHNAHRQLLKSYPNLPLLCAVNPDGTFVPELTKYAGRWVKDCDKEISHELKERGVLLHAETYRHDYPFCWRADSDPLIQFARPAWYIRTTAVIDKAIANNRAVHWLPEHIKEGRFGDFLANNVDWALSRERYWGTPLNVWICSKDETHMHAPASVAEIQKLNPKAFDHFAAAKKKDPSLSEHLIVHKPWIDEVVFPCPTCGAEMRRVPEVIDCWFDSGCMPFAQWGYPHRGQKQLEESFPADFISEAIDQTRGWFYSLLMISTLVFDQAPLPHPFKTCIVLGHVGDREGKKESKSKGNYTPPEIILDRVRMEFGVLDAKDAGVDAKDGTALIARDDLEGLDIQEGATVRLYRGDAPGKAVDLKVACHKKLRRRVVVLGARDRDALGLTATKTVDVKPVEVPRLPAAERVYIEDPSAPAPGADAFRWFFYASSPPWTNTRHSLSNVRALQKDFLVKLRNVYSFFTIYANIDGFVPGEKPPVSHAKRSELDRWILSELALTAEGVTKDLDAYDVYAATGKLIAFGDALSNWYVRRSRDRFWRSGWDDDKRSAYETLYECLVTFTGLIAPFVPFIAEAMYQNLVVGPAKKAGRAVPESVHLTDYPAPKLDTVDRALSNRMRAVRDLVSLGLQVRTQAKLKVRQPLRTAHLIVSDPALRDGLRAAESMIKEELNVLGVHFVPDAEVGSFVEHGLKPNFRTLGQRGLGKEAQMLKKHMAELPADAASKLLAEIDTKGKAVVNGVELSRDDVEVAFSTKPGFAAAGDRVGVVVLETTLDDTLRDLGFLRELQSRLQTARKDMGLEYTDRIAVSVRGNDRVARIVKAYGEELAREVLATSLGTGDAPAGATERTVDVEGESVTIAVARA
jgi:isoleucyl-tRNA synthetase